MDYTAEIESFREHLRSFDVRAHTGRIAEAEAERSKIVGMFPREKWRQMSLLDYAQGQPENPESFCTWLEHRSPGLGSIKGGSAEKLVIYRHHRKGWQYDKDKYADEQEAWVALRKAYLRLFEFVERGEIERADEIETMTTGALTQMKAAYLYLPDKILPCYSRAHLRRFLTKLGPPPEEEIERKTAALNSRLLKTLLSFPEAAKLSTLQLALALYEWDDPRKSGGHEEFTLSEVQVETLLSRLRERMPGFKTFADPGEAFFKNEVEYKRKILERYDSELGNKKLRAMVDSGQALAGLQELRKMTANLVQFGGGNRTSALTA